MANSYASLYLSDVLDKIKDVALAMMMHPLYSDNPSGLSNHNERITIYNERTAIYNDGIRDLAFALKREITEMAEEEEK